MAKRFTVVHEGKGIFEIEVPLKSKCHAVYAAVAEHLGLEDDPKGKAVHLEVQGKRLVRMFGVRFGKLKNCDTVTLVSPSPGSASAGAAKKEAEERLAAQLLAKKAQDKQDQEDAKARNVVKRDSFTAPTLPGWLARRNKQRKAEEGKEKKKTGPKRLQGGAARRAAAKEQEERGRQDAARRAAAKEQARQDKNERQYAARRAAAKEQKRQDAARRAAAKEQRRQDVHERQDAQAAAMEQRRQALEQKRQALLAAMEAKEQEEQARQDAARRAAAKEIADSGLKGNVVASTEVKDVASMGRFLYTKALANGDKVSAMELTAEQAEAMGIKMPDTAAPAATTGAPGNASISPAAASSGGTITLKFKPQRRLFPSGPPGDMTLSANATVQDIFDIVTEKSPMSAPPQKYRMMLVQGRRHVLQAKKGKIRNSKNVPSTPLTVFGVECDGIVDGVHVPALAAMFNYPI